MDPKYFTPKEGFLVVEQIIPEPPKEDDDTPVIETVDYIIHAPVVIAPKSKTYQIDQRVVFHVAEAEPFRHDEKQYLLIRESKILGVYAE